MHSKSKPFAKTNYHTPACELSTKFVNPGDPTVLYCAGSLFSLSYIYAIHCSALRTSETILCLWVTAPTRCVRHFFLLGLNELAKAMLLAICATQVWWSGTLSLFQGCGELLTPPFRNLEGASILILWNDPFCVHGGLDKVLNPSSKKRPVSERIFSFWNPSNPSKEHLSF